MFCWSKSTSLRIVLPEKLGRKRRINGAGMLYRLTKLGSDREGYQESLDPCTVLRFADTNVNHPKLQVTCQPRTADVLKAGLMSLSAVSTRSNQPIFYPSSYQCSLPFLSHLALESSSRFGHCDSQFIPWQSSIPLLCCHLLLQFNITKYYKQNILNVMLYFF